MINHPLENPRPLVRLGILFLGVGALSVLGYLNFGTLFPTDSKAALALQGGLLLVILGSLFLEDKFTVPADALINSLTAFISLLSVVYLNPPFLNYVLGYCGLIFFSSISCFTLGLPTDPDTRFPNLSRFFYKFATIFGKSNVIFSIVLLYALTVFYGVQSQLTLTLLIFWGIYLAMWPLKIPHLIQAIVSRGKIGQAPLGTIIRLESPGLIRVKLARGESWEGIRNWVACLENRVLRRIYPLYSQFQEDGALATGLLLGNLSEHSIEPAIGRVYKFTEDNPQTLEELISTHYRLTDKINPIGLVVEGSVISKIKFEIWDPGTCEEGMLVFCEIGGKRVYYQIVEGTTQEEALEHDRHGFHIAHAIQLGILDAVGKFKKYHWVPSMNIPVFPASAAQVEPKPKSAALFEIGKIPKSTIKVFADLNKLRLYHSAVMGVTGSGKSEFAFDLIRRHAAQKTKVFCVDLTSAYTEKLRKLKPVDLSLTSAVSEDLGQKIHATETTAFGAPAEKKILKEFSDKIRNDVKKGLEDFISNKESYVGLINLPSISNTKAAIHITEIYLSSILEYAKTQKGKEGILIVLEEAHTVIPESQTMGLGDNDSKGMVARISQIALQGRKYNVGLLIIAQRTANVSKTVLSQCNTVFVFSSFDETGINYFSNIVGRDFASALPNLDFLQLVGYGKGLLSDRPLIFQIPYDESKDDEKAYR